MAELIIAGRDPPTRATIVGPCRASGQKDGGARHKLYTFSRNSYVEPIPH